MPSPRQFIGEARQLRSAIQAEDKPASLAIASLARPLHNRANRHHIPRQTALIDAARAWRETVPSLARLALSIEVKKRELVVDELRLAGIDTHFNDWASDDYEPGVGLQLVRLRVGPRVFTLETPIIGAVSLHGLARRYQRGWACDRAAIFGDIAAVANAPDGLQWELPVSGGRWVGVRASLKYGERTELTPVARSFLS